MRNFIQNGQYLDVTPSSAYAGGELVLLGDVVGVAVTDIAANDTGVICCSGVFEFPKDPAAVIAPGDHAHWNLAAKWVTEHGGGDSVVGDITAVNGDMVHLKIYGHTLAKS
jgi:predicted RecA/RadA family phage recombinase